MNSVPERPIVLVSLFWWNPKVLLNIFVELFLWCIIRFVNEILETRTHINFSVSNVMKLNPESYCPAGLSFMSEVETRKRHSLNNGYAEVSLM